MEQQLASYWVLGPETITSPDYNKARKNMIQLEQISKNLRMNDTQQIPIITVSLQFFTFREHTSVKRDTSGVRQIT